jgi:glycosyltransferase involved in cell wall biosynthesis
VTRPRVAIAHDYLTQRGGAERVVLALHRAFPEATVHTLLYDAEETFPEFRDIPVVTSPLNHVSVLRRHHRLGLPVLATAARRMVVDADVTVVSTSGWAHGFDFRGRTVVYCHNPARWLYQAEEYVGDARALTVPALGLRALSPALRRWDRRMAARHDRYLANSTVVRERIRATYGREAAVLFPPATVTDAGPQAKVGPFPPGFHLLVSRLLPYKNVDAVVAAFEHLPDERLVVVGEGPGRKALEQDRPANVELLSNLTDARLRWLYANCRALVAASYEDFGLTPLEAASFGRPTIALRWGGFLDTIEPELSGLFFDQPSGKAIAHAIEESVEREWDPEAIKAHAATFNAASFRARVLEVVQAQLDCQP